LKNEQVELIVENKIQFKEQGKAEFSVRICASTCFVRCPLVCLLCFSEVLTVPVCLSSTICQRRNVLDIAREAMTRKLWRLKHERSKKMGPRHDTELQCVFKLAYQLMARQDRICSTHAAHILWVDDALVVLVWKDKRLMKTTKPLAFRIVANPHKPDICPILGLALHLVCNPTILQNSESLFVANDAASTYAKQLKDICDVLGLDVGKYATHSVRKAAATEGVGGFVECNMKTASEIRML
jgi:hypothetical protein